MRFITFGSYWQIDPTKLGGSNWGEYESELKRATAKKSVGKARYVQVIHRLAASWALRALVHMCNGKHARLQYPKTRPFPNKQIFWGECVLRVWQIQQTGLPSHLEAWRSCMLTNTHVGRVPRSQPLSWGLARFRLTCPARRGAGSRKQASSTNCQNRRLIGQSRLAGSL